MSYCKRFIFPFFQRGFNFRQLWSVANWGLQLFGLRAIRLQAICQRVSKVASMQHQYIFTGLDEIGRDKIPPKCTTAREDEGLGAWVGCLEHITQEGEGLPEGVHERLSNVGLSIVGHGLGDLVTDLNRSWNQERRVRLLRGHFGRR